MNGLANIYSWRSDKQEEVDFVVKHGLKVERLIQVCYDAGDLKTKQREVKALLKAGEELKCRDLSILTDDYEAEETKSWFGIKGIIKFIPPSMEMVINFSKIILLKTNCLSIRIPLLFPRVSAVAVPPLLPESRFLLLCKHHPPHPFGALVCIFFRNNEP
jgi:hypothetical protein